MWIKPYQNIAVTLCRGVDPSQHTHGGTRGGWSRGAKVEVARQETTELEAVLLCVVRAFNCVAAIQG